MNELLIFFVLVFVLVHENNTGKGTREREEGKGEDGEVNGGNRGTSATSNFLGSGVNNNTTALK